MLSPSYSVPSSASSFPTSTLDFNIVIVLLVTVVVAEVGVLVAVVVGVDVTVDVAVVTSTQSAKKCISDGCSVFGGHSSHF